MTDETKPVSLGDSEASPKHRCLLQFLESKEALKGFLTSLETGKADLPDEDLRGKVVQRAQEDTQLAARLVELVRMAAAEETPGKIRKAIMGIGSEYVRAQDKALVNWGLIATGSPEIDLGMLARHVRKARKSKDRALVSNSELALVTGLAILGTRLDFDTVGALRTLGQQLFHEPLEARVADKAIRKVLRRASVKNLETYAAISAIHAEAFEDCRKKSAAAYVELQDRRDELKACREGRKEQDAVFATLEGELRDARSELESIKGKIAGVKGGAAHDITRLKARIRQFFAAKLSGPLSTVDEALGLDPPSYRVARERVRDILTDVRKELEWLDQS